MGLAQQPLGTDTDAALGRKAGQSRPWTAASSATGDLAELRAKAPAVLDGTAYFSREEIQQLLAALLLERG